LVEEAKKQNANAWQLARVVSEGPRHRVEITRAFSLGSCEVTVGAFRQFVDEARYATDAEKNGKGGLGPDEKGAWMARPESTWRHPKFSRTDKHPVVEVTFKDAQAFCHWLTLKEGFEYNVPTEAQWEYACRAGTTTGQGRVIRGGGWHNQDPNMCRSACRDAYPPEVACWVFGFRVARSITPHDKSGIQAQPKLPAATEASQKPTQPGAGAVAEPPKPEARSSEPAKLQPKGPEPPKPTLPATVEAKRTLACWEERARITRETFKGNAPPEIPARSAARAWNPEELAKRRMAYADRIAALDTSGVDHDLVVALRQEAALARRTSKAMLDVASALRSGPRTRLTRGLDSLDVVRRENHRMYDGGFDKLRAQFSQRHGVEFPP
jgi:hypothetical protein